MGRATQPQAEQMVLILALPLLSAVLFAVVATYRTPWLVAGPFRKSTKCDWDRRHRSRRPHRTGSPWAIARAGHTRCSAPADVAYER